MMQGRSPEILLDAHPGFIGLHYPQALASDSASGTSRALFCRGGSFVSTVCDAILSGSRETPDVGALSTVGPIMLSSTASAQPLEANFLARWMPTRHRAGVILNPSADLVSSLRDSWVPQEPDDSFVSHFAPLPASSSSSSSSISVDSLSPEEMGRASQLSDTGSAALLQVSSGARKRELDNIVDLELETNSRPLAEKLQQMKEWQQNMQKQLNGHQTEQLRRLLDEQQSLLRIVVQEGGTDYTEKNQSGDVSGEDSALSQMGASASSPVLSDSSPAPKLGPQPCSISPQQLSPVNISEKTSLGKASHLALHPKNREEEDSDRTAVMVLIVVSYTSTGSESWRDGHTCEAYDDNDEEPEEPTVLENSDQLCGFDKEGAQQECVPSDDRPIKPGVGGTKKTFEELLEEQLRLEEQRLRTTQQQQQQSAAEEVKINPKRTFLKRGQGLSRFSRGKVASTKKDLPSSSLAPPKTSHGPRCPPIQRKTTSLNRENRTEALPTPRDSRGCENKGLGLPSSRPKMLGSHQKQNMAIPEWQKTKTDQIQQQIQKPQAPTHPQARKPGPFSLLAVSVKQAATEQPNKTQSYAPPEKHSPKTWQIPLDHSFELSFQEKLERWDAERHKESMELGEFELLEQAAEELSFSSNSSFVMQVLQLDRQPNRGHQHFRRLSSTPIKSLGIAQPAAARGGAPPCPKDGGLQPGPGEMVNGSCGTDKHRVPETADEDATDASCQSSVVFGDLDDRTPLQGELPSQPTLPSNFCFAVPSSAQYDRKSYQDRGSSSASGQEHDGRDSTSFDEGTDSTLVEDKQGNGEDHFVFDDDDTWNDVEESEDVEDEEEEEADGNDHVERCVSGLDAWNDMTPSGLKRKVATVKGVELESQGLNGAQQESHEDKLDCSVEPPPTSQLVAKLFPSLKPKATPSTIPPALEPQREVAQPDPGPHPQSRQLRERLAELEAEIERFRSENAALARLKQEREAGREALRKEMADFERRKADELAKLEEFRKEETRKLQRERRVFERHASAARALPGKKEREEIQVLKQQLSSLQEELRRREARWSNTHSRLRKQLDALGAENAALRDEVRVLEKLRVAAWKKVESEKEMEKGANSARGAKKVSSTRSKSASPPGAMRTSSELPASTRGSSPESSQSVRSKTNMTPLPGPTPAPKAVGRQATEPRGATTTPSPEMPTALPSEASKLHTGEPCDVKDEEKLHQDEEGSQEEMVHPDGKIERVLPSGARLIVFPNGTRKEVSADGQMVNITFFNGDVKQVMADQRVIYYYADAQTTHTTYPDGIEVIQFPNSQIEKHFPDGRKEITFPDQTVKNLFPDGKEESIFPDGTIVEVQLDGTKVIRFNNGQREVHTTTFKRREYPDGTAKTIYSDGRQETRYPTGRVRIKDKDGRIIVDVRN
ncbi:centromere protein J [Arapaima gigas]